MQCVFFDRDGIVNVTPGPGYVETVDDFHLQDGFIEAARVCGEHGYGVVVITNQQGVAKGIMRMETLDAIHAHMRAGLQAAGVELLGLYCCPHARDTCSCRKPLPGMLLTAAREHAIDLTGSWMVGDRDTDMQAGKAAGCRTILVSGDEPRDRADRAVDTIDQLPALLTQLLERETTDAHR
jgi:D-glycero-D-manno-heptose 1,7-bisphosphate phosphatase